MDTTLLSLILPEGLSEYFELEKAEFINGSHYLYLIEKNIHPAEYAGQALNEQGFL